MKPYPSEARNEVVEISRWAINDPLIEGVEFVNCTIVGPAVIVLVEGVSIINCGWDAPDWDALVWTIPDARELIVGAVGLKNCTFSSCQFRNIGLGVKESDVPDVRAGFGL
ncbi:MAG: hypothetical protein WD080_08675 [Egibacteraceae bacterium]